MHALLDCAQWMFVLETIFMPFTTTYEIIYLEIVRAVIAEEKIISCRMGLEYSKAVL